MHYGAAGAQIATYLPVGDAATLALRGVVDLESGNVPVYDLYTGGVFFTDEMVGGSSSVRGVPDGRYSGKIKAFGNADSSAAVTAMRRLGLIEAGERAWSSPT